MIVSRVYGVGNDNKPSTQQPTTFVFTDSTKEISGNNLIWECLNVTMRVLVFCPMKMPTYCRKSYFSTMVIAHQRYSRVPLLKKRRGPREYFHDYRKWIEHHKRLRALKIHTDDAFDNPAMRKYIMRRWLRLDIPSPYRSRWNGMIECVNRTLLHGARAMMSQANWKSTLGWSNQAPSRSTKQISNADVERLISPRHHDEEVDTAYKRYKLV